MCLPPSPPGLAQVGLFTPSEALGVKTVESVVLGRAQLKTVHGQPLSKGFQPMLVYDRWVIKQLGNTPSTSGEIT